MAPPLDAEAGDGVLEAETGTDHADRPDDRGRRHADLVGGAGQPVAARGGDVLDEGEYRLVVLGREIADPGRDQLGLRRRAAGSEERRVRKEGVSTCRSRWSPYT